VERVKGIELSFLEYFYSIDNEVFKDLTFRLWGGG